MAPLLEGACFCIASIVEFQRYDKGSQRLFLNRSRDRKRVELGHCSRTIEIVAKHKRFHLFAGDQVRSNTLSNQVRCVIRSHIQSHNIVHLHKWKILTIYYSVGYFFADIFPCFFIFFSFFHFYLAITNLPIYFLYFTLPNCEKSQLRFFK